MKKNYVVPRTTSVDVVTENDFALTLPNSNVTGRGTGRGSDLTIGDGGDGTGGAPVPTAKGGFCFWDL